MVAGSSKLAHYANFVKLPHTLFALPFALLGVLAAAIQSPVEPSLVGLVVLAFSSARWVAMGFNRIADREFDAQNPRTARRELPQGLLTVREARWSVAAAAVVFLITCWFINRLCFYLSPVALAWIMAYSYAKRFTFWPHLWLGISLAMAPVGGYLAVSGAWSEPLWLLPIIALGVASWVAGFDIFYALPDEQFDRSVGLRSLVVKLGERRAILTGKLLHGFTIPALVLFGLGAGFGVWFYVGLTIAAAILFYEHRLVKPGDLSKLDAAFFTMNGVMSVTVFAFALLDRVVG